MNITDPGGRSDPERPVAYIRFDGWLGHVENAFNLVAAFAILSLMLLAVVQVVGRLAFNMPVPGFIDITEQAMAIFAFAGVAYCQRVGGHIRMEIVLGTLRGRTLYICELLGVILIAFTVALLIWGGPGTISTAPGRSATAPWTSACPPGRPSWLCRLPSAFSCSALSCRLTAMPA
ncbi:TRAP transporter small permease [Roseibium salinum]|nr:TRAP transporter small permease [Roseibium salinum]